VPDAGVAAAAGERWLPVHVAVTDDASRDAAAAALIALGAEGVQQVGDGLLTYVREGADIPSMRAAVQRASPSAQLEVRGSALEANWAEQWAPRVGIQRVGDLVIAPPWLVDEAGTGRNTIIIEPAMAFGTGEHPTTRGVLRLMQGLVRAGDMVADLGAGSAVLSIAAARLGATRVAAIEMDEDAIGNAEENVRRNDVGDRVKVLHGDAAALLPLVAPVRVLLANILSSVLVQLSPVMRESLVPHGCAIVSGILFEERTDFLHAMAADGWTVEREDREGEWWSARLEQA
jgi:ribosomal protein L11 methyltransferase